MSTKAKTEMMEFKRGLMNWASEDLIQNYLEYDAKLLESQNQNSNFDMLKECDKFLKDLRKKWVLKTLIKSIS